MTLTTVTKAIRHKAARPELSLSIAHSKSPAEVAEHIASGWVGYGLKKSTEGGTSLTLATKPETFDGAMKYLWFKPTVVDDKTTTWRMAGLPYKVKVTRNGENHAIEVIEVIEVMEAQ